MLEQPARPEMSVVNAGQIDIAIADWIAPETDDAAGIRHILVVERQVPVICDNSKIHRDRKTVGKHAARATGASSEMITLHQHNDRHQANAE